MDDVKRPSGAPNLPVSPASPNPAPTVSPASKPTSPVHSVPVRVAPVVRPAVRDQASMPSAPMQSPQSNAPEHATPLHEALDPNHPAPSAANMPQTGQSVANDIRQQSVDAVEPSESTPEIAPSSVMESPSPIVQKEAEREQPEHLAPMTEPPHEDPKLSGKVSHAPTAPQKRKGRAMAAIMVAVLVALALIGGAGYAYLQNKENVDPAPVPQAQPEVPKTKPATSEDVDKTNQTIEENLKKIDDTKDYQEADLSDQTLGL